ncbi:cysteine--tRNA ligase [Gorillibacterium sp. sgz5001074]|uniref:cysteine--tRNA ligase n=1 Tax=Gorillibacterium sp. sgz5001074 TaxID=3446695 RepID=UPI003F66FDDD
MTLKVYNTMHRAKETFEPLEPGKVRMYVCGPTVYNYIHIGNARPVIFFDVVRRYLEYTGYRVTYVVNVTDVDDKMIRRAQEEGTSVPEVAERYIQAFLEDSRALGVKETLHPRVTDNIREIVDFIQGLVDKGFAYPSGGDVYFSTLKFAEYGKLSQQNLEELQFGIRIEVDERKEHAEDFVLWKGAKPGEIAWPSPWGDGRPGWHIECSAMARKYLGNTIDIHGGGQDLTFPHHECEVAQSEALNNQPLARYWMHNGYLNMNNEKMSKSIGNVLNVRDILGIAKPQEFRFVILSTHYRNPLNYNDEVLEQAKNGLERLNNSVANVKHRLSAAAEGPADDEVLAFTVRASEQFVAKMDDDFNTPDAITAMFELVSDTNRYLGQNESVTKGSLEAILRLFQEMDGVLGILTAEGEDLLDAEIEALIAERAEARKAKNWARSDEIRDLLTAKGILLEDTPQGMRWKRK